MLTEEGQDLEARLGALAARLVDADEVDPARPLAEVGFDSIAFAELALAAEDELGIRLSGADLERLATVRSVVAVAGADGQPGRALPEGFGRLQPFAKAVAGPVLRGWFDLRVTGAERVPARGPAIVCANHTSLLDVPFLAIALPRDVWFMAKEELFRGTGATWAWHRLGGFRVRRERMDLRAVAMARAVLTSGRLLGMFPEGTRSPDRLLPFLPGAAWLAHLTGAPLVPAAIHGTGEALPRGTKIPRRARISVAFGEPIHVDAVGDQRLRRTRALEATERLRASIAELLG